MSDERFERCYHGHGRGLVITQPTSGKFAERPMTAAELAAREPAWNIATQIHKLACYAAFAYINTWEIIAPAIDKAVDQMRRERDGEREAREKTSAALREKDEAMGILCELASPEMIERAQVLIEQRRAAKDRPT